MIISKLARSLHYHDLLICSVIHSKLNGKLYPTNSNHNLNITTLTFDLKQPMQERNLEKRHPIVFTLAGYHYHMSSFNAQLFHSKPNDNKFSSN